MFLSLNDKQFTFWKMRRSGMSNISIANLIGITRQGVSQALLIMDEKIETSLREMAKANRIQIEKIDVERGILFGRSIPFQTNAYILVSEKHGMQVWYEHDGDCISCDEFTKCIEFIWDFAAELGIKLEKTQDPTKMAEELLAKIRKGTGMTRVSDVVGHWLGLCQKAPAAHALQTGFSFPPEPAFEGQPGGGGSGSGSVRRGIESALSGMRTLNRNRQLLWFTLLAGLVLAGTVIAQGALGYIAWAMQPYIGETEWIVLNFIIEFATLFLLVFLLTGLILSISSKKDSSPSFFDGLAGAKKYLRPIVVWSFVLAIAGMLLFSISFYSPGWFSRNDPFLTIIGAIDGPVNVLYEFPFNPALTPSTLFDPYREGGIPLTFWIYPSGIVQALIISGINLFLFILTAFVVPLIVLEQKTIREAVGGSFALMKKNWAEVAACAIFLLVIAIGVLLTYLLVQAASGIATPEWGAVTIRPENTWIALALVYDAALFCFAVLMATVGGIAAMNLYISAKSRQITAESAGATGGGT